MAEAIAMKPEQVLEILRIVLSGLELIGGAYKELKDMAQADPSWTNEHDLALYDTEEAAFSSEAWQIKPGEQKEKP